VISFRDQFDQKIPLDELVREGARRMLLAAIDTEVEAFVAMHQDRRSETGFLVGIIDQHIRHARRPDIFR